MPFLTEEQKKRIEQAEEKGDIATALVEMKGALEKRDDSYQRALDDLKTLVKGKASTDEVTSAIAKVDDLGKKAQELNNEMLELQQKMSRPIGGPAEAKSYGQQIVEHEDFGELKTGRVRTLGIDIKGFDKKAITSATGSAGVLVQPERLPGVQLPPEQQFYLRDLIMPGTTNSNAIEYVREKAFTNNAAPVAELATKPESDITYELLTTPVRTLAHWIPASKQIFDDAPQLASLINGRLIYGLKFVEEQQLLLGDGTGQNLLGIIPQATAYSTALETSLAIQNKNKMDILRVAMLQIQLALYPPSGIVLHPTDWAGISLTKDVNGNYLIGNPQSLVSQLLWSLPVVASMSMTQGDFLVGAFHMGAQIFDRELANIAVSWEHADNFVKNTVTIRAEERLALAVYRPASFVHGTF